MPKPRAAREASRTAAGRTTAIVSVNLYLTRYLVGLYRMFDGDLVEAIVLGEIAHHNLSGLLNTIGGVTGFHASLRAGRPPDRSAYLPTNAFSIAQATGIPRQTVRRKVASLTKRGWLTTTPDGGLLATDRPFHHFAQFNAANVDDFLDTADELSRLLRKG